MKAVLQFLRTTLVGGILFLIPVVLIVLLLGKALSLAGKLLTPIAERLPIAAVAGIAAAEVLAAVVLVLIGFVAGLFAKTGLGRRLGESVESMVLRKVPGFTLVKSMTQGSLGVGRDEKIKVAFAYLDEAWVIAFIMEEPPGGLLTVFVPSAPTPTAGALYFLREEQVRRVNVSVREAIQCIMQLGVGSQGLLAKAGSALAPRA